MGLRATLEDRITELEVLAADLTDVRPADAAALEEATEQLVTLAHATLGGSCSYCNQSFAWNWDEDAHLLTLDSATGERICATCVYRLLLTAPPLP